MRKWLVGLFMLTTAAKASEVHLVEPKNIYVDVYKYEDLYDPYIAPIDKEILYGGLFNLDLTLVKYRSFGLYWDNQLHFDQSHTTGQVKRGGWQYELGLSYFDQYGISRIELFKEHHSQHIFEESRPQHFPVYDRYGIRFRIYP